MAEEVIQQEKDSRQQGLNLGLSDKSQPDASSSGRCRGGRFGSEEGSKHLLA